MITNNGLCGESYTWTVTKISGLALVTPTPSSGSATLQPLATFNIQQAVAIDAASPLGSSATLKLEVSVRGVVACLAVGRIDVVELPINAEVTDQDDPLNVSWTTLAEDSPIYGGSEASTADDVRLSVVPGAGTVSNIVWSTDGVGGGSFAPPPSGPSATQWILGDVLAPIPGEITFKVEVQYADGRRECGEFKSEIGVRTDDVIVVGWINPAMVTLPAVNDGGAVPVWYVNPFIAGMMQPTGYVPNSLECNLLIADLSEGLTTLGPGGPPLSMIDRTYILNWMFRYGQDNASPTFGPPPPSFQSNGVIDYDKVTGYVQDVTKYKVVAHLQIRYLKDANTNTFKQPPTVIPGRGDVNVGSTKNPCRGVLGIPDIVPAQTGPATTVTPHVTETHVSLIADASPDARAVRAFDTLTSVGVVDWKVWENVGCRIIFRADGMTSPELSFQPYPSFYEYRNGVQIDITPQTPDPTGHFYGPGDTSYPVYPFGTTDCDAVFGLIRNSRCGDATSQPSPFARIPEYTVR